MRGRSPQHLHLSTDDVAILQRIARRQTLSWYQVRRARTVLGITQYPARKRVHSSLPDEPWKDEAQGEEPIVNPENWTGR